MDGVSERLSRLLADQLGLNVGPGESLEPDSTIDSLGMDSLDVVELTMAAEEEWGIEISDDEVESLETFRHAVALIERHIGRRDAENEAYMAGRRNRVGAAPAEHINVPVTVVHEGETLDDAIRRAEAEGAAEAMGTTPEVAADVLAAAAQQMAQTTLQETPAGVVEAVTIPRPPRRPAWRNGHRSGFGRRMKWHLRATGIYPTACGRVVDGAVVLTRDEFLLRRIDDCCSQCRTTISDAEFINAQEVAAAVDNGVETIDAPSRVLKFDLFTQIGSEEQPIYMIDSDNLHQSIRYTDRSNGWLERLRECRGDYEGRHAYSMTRDQLDRFLPAVKRIVTGRWGSGSRHVEWVRIGTKTRFPPELGQSVHIPDFPAFPVEDVVGRYPGGFTAIAAAILGPMLQRKIVFVNEMEFSERGGFQIYIANRDAMYGRRSAATPSMLFGIQDKNDYPRHINVYAVDPEHTSGVYIRDGNLVVAEVYPNALAIFAEVGDDFFGLRVFTRILQESVRYFGSPEEYERMRREAEQAFRNQQRQHIVQCAERAIRWAEQNRGLGNIREVQSREHLRREIRDAETRLFQLHQQLFAVENSNNNNTMERITREFDTLADGRFNLVKKVYFTANGEFHMITDPIIAYDRSNRKYHLLGECKMIVHLPGSNGNGGQGYVRILQNVGPGQRAIPLPHCGSDGGVCFGNIRHEITSLVAGFEIQALASLVIAFLQRPNIRDPDGVRVRNFPECAAPAAHDADAERAAYDGRNLL